MTKRNSADPDPSSDQQCCVGVAKGWEGRLEVLGLGRLAEIVVRGRRVRCSEDEAEFESFSATSCPS